MDVYSKKNNNDNFDFSKSKSFKAAVAEAVQQAMGDDGARRERHGLNDSLGKCNKNLRKERNNFKTERGKLETRLDKCLSTGEQNRKAERIALEKERDAKDELQRLLNESRNEGMGKDRRIADFETELAECRKTVAKAESARESESRVLEFIEKTNAIMAAFSREHGKDRNANYDAFPEQIDALAREIDGVELGDALGTLKEIILSFRSITVIAQNVSARMKNLLEEKENMMYNQGFTDAELLLLSEKLEKLQDESEGLHAEMSWLRTFVSDEFKEMDTKTGDRLEQFVAEMEARRDERHEEFVAEVIRELRKPNEGDDDAGGSMKPDRVPDSVRKMMGNRQIPPNSPGFDYPFSPRWNDEYMQQRIANLINDRKGFIPQNLDERFGGAERGAGEKKDGSPHPGDNSSDDDEGNDLDALIEELNEQFRTPPSFDELGGIWTEELAEELHNHVENPVSPWTNTELVKKYANDLLRDTRYSGDDTGDDTQDAMNKMYKSLVARWIPNSDTPEDAFDEIHENFRFITHDGDYYNLSQTHAFHAFRATRKYLLQEGHTIYKTSRNSNVRLFFLVVSKTGIEFREFGDSPFLFPPDSSASSALSALFPWL